MPTQAASEEVSTRRQAFIGSLLRLARPDAEGEKDRAAMAALRGSLRGTPIDNYRAAKYVVSYLGDKESGDDQWFFLVGGLLALHPQHEQGISLGKAFHHLRDDSGSIDSRMLALLNTPGDALPRVLRQMVDLLRARGLGLDYDLLLRDLCYWNATTGWVQKRWARDYFRDTKKADPAKDSAADNANKEDNNED